MFPNLPPFLASAADSGKYYRVIVATSAANLVGNCAFNDGSSTLIKVINCSVILNGNFTQFKGQLIQKNAYLTWSASAEENLRMYEIEKSTDGINFEKISSLNAKNTTEASYNFTDPNNINGITYYRLKMTDMNGVYKYSSIIQLSTELSLEINNLNNPFKNIIKADVVVPKDGLLYVVLFNEKGQLIKNIKLPVTKGLNNIVVNNINSPNGVYFLSIDFNNEAIKRKLVKLN